MTKYDFVSVLRKAMWMIRTCLLGNVHTVLNIHSFIFSMQIIQVRVLADLEPIPGTPGWQQQNIMNGTAVHHRAHGTVHLLIHFGILILNQSNHQHVVGGVMKLQKQERTIETQFRQYLSSGSKPATLRQQCCPQTVYNKMTISLCHFHATDFS